MPSFGQNIEKKKAAALEYINTAVGNIRLTYITVIPGQEMHYLEKRDEAKRCSTDANPFNDNYPMLASEIGVTASTLTGVAQVILQRYQQFVTIESALNRVRIEASSSIQNATTVGGVQQALTIFQTSLAQAGFPA